MSTTRKVTLRLNSGADLGSQERINFLEGANITIVPAEVPADKEFTVTITAAGLPPAWLDQFYPVVNPDTRKGSYPSGLLPDAYNVTIYQSFMIPKDIVTITRAVAIIIPDGSGDLYWSCVTNFGQVCDNEGYQTHADTIALNATAVTADEIECIDISDALTDAVGGDIVGITFTREASDALDTVNADCYYLGILIEGSV